MRFKGLASFALGLALLGTLSGCIKGTVGRYKGMIESYSNEADVKELVFLNDELMRLSDEYIKADYTIAIEAFERDDVMEYFKYNKLDTTKNSFIELNRNKKIKYDNDTTNFQVTESTKSISEGNTVDEALNSNSSTETELFYEENPEGSVLYNNKRMSMEKLPAGVWQRIKKSMSPYDMLHTLGVLRYIENLPKKYFIDDNKYTTLIDYNDADNDYFGEIQLIISSDEIKAAYHFKHSLVEDGSNVYVNEVRELGGLITISKDKNKVKDRVASKFVNINERGLI